mmetsp:Transcript_92804/g.262088  ORF Transcript_92804/g.262088 Transcript_92804/m.262088 type:complete len:251 (+) Transcript_92804:2-754(+)
MASVSGIREHVFDELLGVLDLPRLARDGNRLRPLVWDPDAGLRLIADPLDRSGAPADKFSALRAVGLDVLCDFLCLSAGFASVAPGLRVHVLAVPLLTLVPALLAMPLAASPLLLGVPSPRPCFLNDVLTLSPRIGGIALLPELPLRRNSVACATHSPRWRRRLLLVASRLRIGTGTFCLHLFPCVRFVPIHVVVVLMLSLVDGTPRPPGVGLALLPRIISGLRLTAALALAFVLLVSCEEVLFFAFAPL